MSQMNIQNNMKMIFAKKTALEVVLKQLQTRFCNMDVEELEESNLTEEEYRIFGNEVKHLSERNENCEEFMITILDKYCIEAVMASSKGRKLVNAVRESIMKKYIVTSSCLNQVIINLANDYDSIFTQLEKIGKSQGDHYPVKTVLYNASTQERIGI